MAGVEVLTAADLISGLRARGLELRVEGEQIRFRPYPELPESKRREIRQALLLDYDIRRDIAEQKRALLKLLEPLDPGTYPNWTATPDLVL